MEIACDNFICRMEEDQAPAAVSRLDQTTTCLKETLATEEEEIVESEHAAASIEDQYQFASLLVVRQHHLKALERQLQRYKFDCEVVSPFLHLDIIGAKYIAILYHNNPFSQVIPNLRYNTDFMFEGRQTMAVPITDMIHLINRSGKRMLPKSDFDKLHGWTQEVTSSNAQLSLWRYLNNENESEIYLKTESKACTALLYLVLNFSEEKVKLRNPKDIEKAQCVINAKPRTN